mmetsp:Transcript_15095/g.19075  ORF Transcript_15095/g.19075 Transcript_15095/m.19075 type:complete len:176 (-) Transcript_15095:174-701(-)|eukprot:CAMPEP_0170476410 /NCGR_PEP_ID=MMETSP0123-20130129/17816_1 /TAXON_ID=182087 /ORGANISM="Favella ehrenbergii, Strain Fehren 1" /LENGTH=175 /DNA_ID=CAMNT_0010747403 /DNA_START=268 /DNA_END=795 /DNA_ORIENTATION=+
MIYSFLFVMNLMRTEDSYLDPVCFWIQGLFYYIFLLFCLASYRDQRELCFYCKYEMSMGGAHCILGFFMTRAFQWAFVVVVLFILTCVIIVRQAQKEDREEERIRRLETEKYTQASQAEPAKVGESGDQDVSIAYLTPGEKADGERPKQRTAAPVTPPPKAKVVGQAGNAETEAD